MQRAVVLTGCWILCLLLLFVGCSPADREGADVSTPAAEASAPAGETSVVDAAPSTVTPGTSSDSTSSAGFASPSPSESTPISSATAAPSPAPSSGPVSIMPESSPPPSLSSQEGPSSMADPAPPADPVHILFVGNSFVHVGEVPNQIYYLSGMYGQEALYTDLSTGGASLNESMARALQYMELQPYDYVVIQDYGTRPVEDTSGFLADVEVLCAAAREHGAQPVLYNPAWANVDGRPDVEYQDMETGIYEKAAQENDALLVNAGDAWVYAYQKHPDLSLYQANDYHANTAGAYLTACVFVSTLFDLHVRDISEWNLYQGEHALELGQAAWEFVCYYKEHGVRPRQIVSVPDGSNRKVG